MKKLILSLTLAGLSTLSFATFAQDFKQKEKNVLELMKKNYPAMNAYKSSYVSEVNLFEIATKLDGATAHFFTNDKLEFLINIKSGEVLSLKTKENITIKREFDRQKEAFNSLPFDTALVTKKGDGSRKIAIFSDPDCPVCQNMEKSWKEFPPENVTIYYFMNPLKTLHPKAEERAKKIFCADNPIAAWEKYTTAYDRRDLDSLLPNNLGKCDKAKHVDQHDNIASLMKFYSTPTIMFDNGVIFEGMLNKEQVKNVLNSRK
jgi:thiol:disulfide interchange protein DsbC